MVSEKYLNNTEERNIREMKYTIAAALIAFIPLWTFRSCVLKKPS